MDLKSAIQNACYDIEQKVRNEKDTMSVLIWAIKRLEQTKKHYEMNEVYRKKNYVNPKKQKPKKWKAVKK